MTQGGKVTTPLTHLPMSQEEFLFRQQGQLQDRMLYDPEQHKEVLRHQRELEKDFYRSQLKREEYACKQQEKQVSEQILEINGEPTLQKINGHGQLLKQRKLFSCCVLKVYRFHRKGMNGYFWQIQIKTEGKIFLSELYPEEMLQSICKLKKTILGQYDCSIAACEKTAAWNWMRQKLFRIYEQAQIIELPYLAGWFFANGHWHFWVKEKDSVLLASEVINRFKRKDFPVSERRNLAKEILATQNQFDSEADLGILLIFRFLALLVRLVKEEDLPSMGLTLVGERAVDIAKAYLRTMEGGGTENDFDIVNLDSDRLETIRKKVFEVQDTPLIFLSSCPRNRSTQKRLEEVKSWQKLGYIEGKKVLIPFIFCFPECSPEYGLDESTVLLTEEIQGMKSSITFDQIQNFLIETVENGGLYWVTELKKCYEKKKHEAPDEAELLILGRTIVDTMLKMLDSDKEEEKRLREIFEQGLQEMKQQLFLKTGILPEIFKNKIKDLCDRGRLFVCDRKSGRFESEGEERVIYFDEGHYYFSKNALDFISTEANFSSRALLEVKRELAARQMVKQYRAVGQRQSEFEVDIFVGQNERKRKLSVFALKRSFCDEFGKIALWERSEC